MIIRSILAVAAVALVTTAATAQQDPIKDRDALMKANGRHFYGSWNRMLRGQEPFDQAKVEEALAQFVDTAAKFTALFPDDSKPPKDTTDQYIASPKVWENKADFNAKTAAFGKVSADYRGKVKDLDGLKTARADIAKTCDACHETYQMRTR